MFEKILDKLNIKPDNHQKWILLSLFISGLLITYSSPVITKAIITALPAEWIAFQSLFSSISALIIGMMWQGKIREKIIKYFFGFCIAESIIGCLLGLYLCFVNYNVWIFAIVSLIYTNLITLFVKKCIMAFKPKLWNEKAREIYDNNMDITYGICCIIGFVCALLFMPSLKVGLFLWSICCIVDDIGWIIVFNKNKILLKKNEKIKKNSRL